MKLFQSKRRGILAFGFDMAKGKPDPRVICWSDPITGSWELHANNEAGRVALYFDLATEFVFEADGRVCAYQPGLCVELTYVGGLCIWDMKLLRPDS